MRCRSCNSRLKLAETSYKGAVTGEYIDICDKCLALSENYAIIEGHGIDLEDFRVDEVDHE